MTKQLENYIKIIRQSREAKYTSPGQDLTQAVLGLVSEAGEVADIFGTRMRQTGEVNVSGYHTGAGSVALELGDVIYYVLVIAALENISIDQIIKLNIEKLQHRGEIPTEPQAAS